MDFFTDLSYFKNLFNFIDILFFNLIIYLSHLKDLLSVRNSFQKINTLLILPITQVIFFFSRLTIQKLSEIIELGFNFPLRHVKH